MSHRRNTAIVRSAVVKMSSRRNHVFSTSRNNIYYEKEKIFLQNVYYKTFCKFPIVENISHSR